MSRGGILAGLLCIALIVCTSCSQSPYHARLLLAEEQVTGSADSCAVLLADIPVSSLYGEDEALYGLVSSWLLYRQYAAVIPEEPLQRAFDYYHDSQDPLRRAQVYFLRSVIGQDQHRGQPSQWMEDLYAACIAIQQTDDYLLASQIYQNYASKCNELNRFDEGLVWADKFVEASRLSGHRGEYVQSLIVRSHNRLYAEEARVQREYGVSDGAEVARYTQFDEAFASIYAALAIAQQYQMEVELGRIYMQLSMIHSRCQHLDSLLCYARLSTAINERLYAQGKRKQLPHYIMLADAHRKLGQADSAIYYARKTYEMPGMPLRNKRVAAQMLYNTYADLKGDYQTSLVWMRIYNQLNDSIAQGTIATNIEAVQDAAVSEQEKTVLRKEQQHTQDWLVWSLCLGSVIIAVITFWLFRNRRRYRLHLQQQEREFNEKILEMRTSLAARHEGMPMITTDDDAASVSDAVQTAVAASAEAVPDGLAVPSDAALSEAFSSVAASSEAVGQDASTPTVRRPLPPGRVTLTGSTRELIEVEASSILFLSSESNYVKVLHLDANGKVQSKMIRQTMNNIEAQLNAFPYIVRCHRAFIVNLQHVRHASTTTSGLQLTLDATTLLVPVSKTYMALIKAGLG